MTILVAGLGGLIGGFIGAWLETKYGPIVILWYVLALLGLLVALRWLGR
jgi:uncharacterized membrane protein YfcA